MEWPCKTATYYLKGIDRTYIYVWLWLWLSACTILHTARSSYSCILWVYFASRLRDSSLTGIDENPVPIQYRPRSPYIIQVRTHHQQSRHRNPQINTATTKTTQQYLLLPHDICTINQRNKINLIRFWKKWWLLSLLSFLQIKIWFEQQIKLILLILTLLSSS